MVEQDVAPEKAVDDYLWAQNVIHYTLLSGKEGYKKRRASRVCYFIRKERVDK